MDSRFDEAEEEAKLAQVREREEEDVARILSDKYGLLYADLSLKEIDNDALRTIPEAEARSAEAAAFAKTAKALSLAVHNPNNPALAKLREELKERGFRLQEFLVSKKSLEKALARYADLSFASESKAGVFIVTPETLSKLMGESGAKNAFERELTAAVALKSLDRVSRVLEVIMAGAFALRASDIHLEPEDEKTRLRLRVDGLLSDAHSFDPALYRQLNSRIKLLGGAKLNISNRAQDGRFSVTKNGNQTPTSEVGAPTASVGVEVRASFIPGNYGESIVLRILDPETTKVPYTELGIHPKLLARLEKEIRRPNGMLLTTGPTGSGKTTTLYSFLREIHNPEIKIITIEDPVEYHLDGIVQTQVEGNKYTFAEGLKSIVRQDPDIIMVGEIRDGETANIAIQAALTGHFVFSTLHTNDAAGTFPRLADLGADPKSFGSAVTVSMAQRLVRKLDPDKKKERALADDEKKMIAKVFENLADKSLIPEKIETVWEPAPASGDETGYKGRIGLYEAIFMDDELAHFLRDNPPENEIAKVAAKQGYLTMAQDGILKALAGITSLSEVASTVDLPRV
ncbi:Flp pilus assembly complex ATPase component TadA [Candidatus Kaiserbacteria bacterium]|nr:Flp pilus assembly complex ATPase component TadA [Candidatus Kaiserbacteria bacterium]